MIVKAMILWASLSILAESSNWAESKCESQQIWDVLTVICDTKELIAPLCEVLQTDATFKGICWIQTKKWFQVEIDSPNWDEQFFTTKTQW